MARVYQCKNKDILTDTEINNDDIYLIYQFFIHNNEKRFNEIKFCLKKNVELKLFKQIILLNERIYTKEELGLTDNEMENILQININKRLKYVDVLLQVKLLKLNGYVAFCNSDIFFDKTIINLRKSCLSSTKSIYSLLRFEYKKNDNLSKCKLFIDPIKKKPRSDSQDVWIYHTNQIEINSQLLRDTDFMLGMPGCDNKITYEFAKLGYRCINEPYNVKTYHYHETQIRNYGRKDVIPSPYLYVEPITK